MLPIRDQVRDQFADNRTALGKPGTWWTARERQAMVAELRHAPNCKLCALRVDALSPNAVEGEHDSLCALPEAVVDVIHRLRTDSGRLTRAWFDSIVPDAMSREAYIEIVGLVGHVTIMDTYNTGLGLPLEDMPPAETGEPTQEASLPVIDDGAWVPILKVEPGDPGRNPNIFRSLALVPAIRRRFLDTFQLHYMLDGMRLAIERPQIELIAARMSALNQCFY